jgi:cation:H+ antiporter
VLATIRGERDIAVGNVIGSNLFNLMSVLGLGATIAPGGIAVPPEALWFDIPVMIAVAVACLPILGSGRRIARWEGGLFLVLYAAYVFGAVQIAIHTPSTGLLWKMVAVYVIPLTVLTFVLVVVDTRRAAGRTTGSGSAP